MKNSQDQILKKVTLAKETAVLVIDLQNAYCSPDGSLSKKYEADVAKNHELLDKVESFLEVARSNGALVIFTRMIEDYNEMPPNAQLIEDYKSRESVVSSFNSFDFEYAKLRPLKDDIEIIKKSYSAFHNPELESVLERNKIKNIIILGVNSDVCVDSTIRSAYNRGYNVVVPFDLTSTIVASDHRRDVLKTIWEQFYSIVVESKTISKIWSD